MFDCSFFCRGIWMEWQDREELEHLEKKRKQWKQDMWQRVQTIWNRLVHLHRRGNQKFSGRWSDGQFVFISLSVVFLVIILMLWLPRYLGMANDGSITRTMQNAGLLYREVDEKNANDYFTRIYQLRFSATEDHSFQLVLIGLAKWLDNLFTGDAFFNVQFLSIIYVLLALPAWALLEYSVVSRVSAFVEKCVLCVLCTLVLADVSYLTYFNSLYPEAIYVIALCYLMGGCMMLQKRSRFGALYWLAILAGTVMLCMTRQHCFIIGFMVAFYCISQLRIAERNIERTGIALVAVITLVAAFGSLVFIENDFDDTSKVHAMTRGVLLQSNQPSKTVHGFDMDESYALLADVSLYEKYALTEEEEYYLQHGFLDHYTTADIVLYYVRHPSSMLSMLDLGARSAMNLRREYCGNYENTAGMPAQGKSIFFAMYSIFKSRSFPHTIAFLFLLEIVCAVMSKKGWWTRKEADRFYYVYFCTTLLAFGIPLFHLAEIICRSGDAQMVQYNFIAGFSIDCLILFTMSELLHRLNILEESRGGTNE